MLEDWNHITYQYSFIRKSLIKISIEEMCFNMIKTIYEEPIANIIFNGEKLKTFPLRLRGQGCCLSPLLFNVVLEGLATTTKQEK